MPLPALVRVPVVVPITPPMLVLPTPPTESGRVAPPMAAERVSVPPSAVTVAPPAPRVMAPDQVLLLARLRSAPVAAMPVPMRLVMGSATRSPEPSISMAAPEATVVPPAVVPRAALDCTRSTPAVRVVTPV